MSVPNVRLVCQAIIAAALIIAAAVWFSIPRYVYLQTTFGIVRGDARRGSMIYCVTTEPPIDRECRE